MMNKKELIEKIGSLLNGLNESYARVQSASDINPLEIELFEVNSIYFAEHTKILTKLLSKDSSPEEAPIVADAEPVETFTAPVEETYFTPKTRSDEEEHESIKQEEARAKDMDERMEHASKDDEMQPDPIVARNGQAKSNDQPDSTFQPKETVHEVRIESKEVFIEEPKQRVEEEADPQRPLSLNERISAQRQQSQSTGVGYHQRPEMQQRIKDIKSAISLNDKLLFIKDLFNGYSLAYSEAIELLNRCGNFEDAHQFLQSNYAEKNHWASKQSTVDKLYDILKKRYGQY